MIWLACGLLLITTLVLCILLTRKVKIDTTEKNKIKFEVESLKIQKDDLDRDIEVQQNLIEDYSNKIYEAQQRYNNEMRDRTVELNEYFAAERNSRQEQLDEEFSRKIQDKEQALRLQYENTFHEYQLKERDAVEAAIAAEEESNERILAAVTRAELAEQEATEKEKQFNALLEPIRQYEQEKQARLFYTIQVPDEYKEDIDFLLTTVAAKVQHPDVINKLVWAEYVKPYIDETFKRVGIEDKAGIYKLTSLIDGKCYIGKSTNIKKRISDHMKSVVGIQSIADQVVHHAIAKDGYWNWTIEPIIYCDKEQLNDLEKYYIDFFKSQEFGYNKNVGGGG